MSAEPMHGFGDSRKARPFLKWAGGKQQLLHQFEPYFPHDFQRYIEPFVGGGAVFFHLWNAGRLNGDALLFDVNEELVNAYTVVRDHVDELVKALAVHKKNHSRDYYYEVRSQDRHDKLQEPVERAARTIYLNKTCYNGLYRVNSKGQFNVPMGRYKNPRILEEDVLRAASEALQRVTIGVRDFRDIVDIADAGDFIYFDPPYHPLSQTASFTSYTAGSFAEDDQRDLAGVFARLDKMGCKCMLSNSDTPLINVDLYADAKNKVKVYANRAINSKTGSRGTITEVLVMNYFNGVG